LAFCWKPVKDPQSGKCQLKARLEVEGDRWLGFGFGYQMADAHVIVAHSSQVSEYRLTARSSSGVNAFAGTQGIIESDWTLQGGKRVLVVAFSSIAGQEIRAEACSSDINRRQLALQGKTDFIFAVGASIDLAQHEIASGLSLALASGAVEQSTQSPTKNSLVQVHAFLMTVTFAICLPILVILPFHKHRGEAWFLAHRVMAGLTMTLLIAALVSAFAYVDSHFSKPHHWVGLAAAAVLCINPFLGLLRPAKEHKSRPLWFAAHRVVGYGALGLGLVAMILGGKLVTDSGLPEFFGAQSFVAAISFAIAALLLYFAGRFVGESQRTASHKTSMASELKEASPVPI
jgi:hypothetical protein